MMSEQDVVDLLRDIEKTGTPTWIGGGWGITALVGFQSRPHSDLDVYINSKYTNVFIEMLISKGYGEVKKEYTTNVHTVWQNSSGCLVDLHLLDFDGTDTFYFDKEPYPSNVLNGKGIIDGITVQCFTAEAQLLFHQGYEHNENDIHDVLLLCKTFGLDIPEEYKLN
ncbi:MAG: aminoglycoside nucleotidyltransferase [Spirochaetaceae bacterium]|nr:aminoglycoside nucleotidyltransferase [Spirochaetaceae bacterium]